jgi:hypothetical protein
MQRRARKNRHLLTVSINVLYNGSGAVFKRFSALFNGILMARKWHLKTGVLFSNRIQ